MNKMTIDLEMEEEFEGRWAVWESIDGIPYLPARISGSTVGTHEVDGHYWVGKWLVRQIRGYGVRTPHEAVDRAKADGLSIGIMVETILIERESFAPGYKRRSIKYNLPFDN